MSERLPKHMKGFVLTGHGGPDKLVWREDLPLPDIGAGEVLIRVLASSLNNTDINTRVGWYSSSVRGDTASASQVADNGSIQGDGAWNGSAVAFPRIQGADCYGEIVAVGRGVPETRMGERVLVRSLQTTGAGDEPMATWAFANDCDGAFAEFTKTFAQDAFAVKSTWSDVELATIPVVFSTAEGMIQRAGLGAERVLISGASGGVGSAAIQLAKRRGAYVAAIASSQKMQAVREIGADEVIERGGKIAPDSFDVVLDLVGGPDWPGMIGALRRGGRYVAAGAIGGPILEFDLRILYLRDLTFYGSSFQPDNIFPDLIGYIERDEIRPMVSEIYNLRDLHVAQQSFMEKKFVGKIGVRVAGTV